MKKSRAGWPIAISALFLLGVLGLTKSTAFLPRSLLFVCGALLAVIGLVWALLSGGGKAAPVLSCVLLAAYVLTFAFLFRTETLESLTSPYWKKKLISIRRVSS